MSRFKRADHVCPECLGRFFGPAKCRGTMGKGFHPEPVQTLPLVGCEEPERRYKGTIEGMVFVRRNAEEAREGVLNHVKWLLGGDTKLAAKMLDRIGFAIDVREIDPPPPK